MQEVRELRTEVRCGREVASSPTLASVPTPAPAPTPRSAKDSCSLAFNGLPEGTRPCMLYLSEPCHRLVGTGTVYNIAGDSLHTTPLPPGHVKVSIDVAIEGNAPIPQRLHDEPDIMSVEQAVGYLVAWPIGLVSFDVADIPAKSASQHTKQSFSASKNDGGKRNVKTVVQNPSPPPIADQPQIELPRLCKIVNVLLQDMPNDQVIYVPFDPTIFGYYHEETVTKVEIDELIKQMIGLSVINIYIRLLWDVYVRPLQITNRFIFVSAHRTQIRIPTEERRKHIVDTMQTVDQLKEKLIIVPYNVGEHWVLLAINPMTEVIHYLDSCHGDPNNRKDMKNLFDEVVKVLRSHLGNQVPKKKQNKITWIRIQCPKQPNYTDCGFYVMRFIKEIVACNVRDIPKEYFPQYNGPIYSLKKINEVKEEWCKFMMDNKYLTLY